MRYSYRCSECKEEYYIITSVEEYAKLAKPTCSQGHGEMSRIFGYVPVTYVGDGFTGAQKTFPKMDKEKLKKDLASPTGIKI